MKSEGSRTFLAYFVDLKDAEAAQDRLRRLGVSDVSLDEMSGEDENVERVSPLTGDFSGLTDLTLGAQRTGDDTRVLEAVHPDASGMADADDLSRYRWVLAAVVDDPDLFEQARQIIQRAGGYL